MCKFFVHNYLFLVYLFKVGTTIQNSVHINTLGLGCHCTTLDRSLSTPATILSRFLFLPIPLADLVRHSDFQDNVISGYCVFLYCISL